MNKKALFAILLTIFIDLLGVGILIPVIPQLFANPDSSFYLLPAGFSVGQGYILLGLLTALYPFMQFFATPVLGSLSDRFGRKPVLAISLLGTCLSYILFAIGIITRNLPLLFISRAFDGITGGNIAVAQAAIADVSAPQDRAKNFGLIGAAFGMGFILGPFIGGKLSDPTVVGWFTAATPFWFAAVISFINVVMVLKLFPETLVQKSKQFVFNIATSFKNIIAAFTLPNLRSLFISSFLFQAGFTFFTTFFSVFLINKFGFSQGSIGNYFAYVGIWIAFSQVVVTRATAKRFDAKTILSFSLIGTGSFILLHFIPSAWWGLLFLTPFFAMFNGLSQANLSSLVSRSVGPERQGEILGINSSVAALAQTIPPVLSGFIAASLAPYAPVVVSGVIIIISGIVFILSYKNKIQNPNTSPSYVSH